MHLILLAHALLLPLADHESALKRYQFSQPKMGTTCQLVLYASSDQQARVASQKAFARVDFLNRIMSDYDPESELRQICASPARQPKEVSPELFYVLKKAQGVSHLSHGAFDISVGPVVKLWRRSRKSIQLPDPGELMQALKLVDYRNIVLGERTVTLIVPGMMLDLGGIAKGYAADEALKVLKGEGISVALVALGGDVALGDAPPGEKGWRVGIAPVLEVGDATRRHVLLANRAISTSGDTEQYVEIEGKRYSHLVDPRTGVGLTRRISVTVVANHGIDSDALTKVVSVLGPEEGLNLLEKIAGVSARIVVKTEAGLKVTTAPGFPEIMEPKDKKEQK